MSDTNACYLESYLLKTLIEETSSPFRAIVRTTEILNDVGHLKPDLLIKDLDKNESCPFSKEKALEWLVERGKIRVGMVDLYDSETFAAYMKEADDKMRASGMDVAPLVEDNEGTMMLAPAWIHNKEVRWKAAESFVIPTKSNAWRGHSRRMGQDRGTRGTMNGEMTKVLKAATLNHTNKERTIKVKRGQLVRVITHYAVMGMTGELKPSECMIVHPEDWNKWA